MAFWGVEVKPGKPVIHSCEKARGRLRISQATLGISDAAKKSIVQCNIGKRSPVLLCVLLPNHTESCQLDLEFEEADDVIFSVIGPRSVYLTGYYVRKNQQTDAHSDSESYGVDIEDTQTEDSSYHSDDDKYDDSFIDDDELHKFAPSPVISSKVRAETESEDDKPKNRNGRGNRLKKKCQVIESETDATSHGSEDEDGYLLSVFKSKRALKTTLNGVEANSVHQDQPTGNKTGQMHAGSHESKDEDGHLLPVFKNKRAEKTTLTGVEGNVSHDLPMRNKEDQMHSLDLAKANKKRKERSKEDKTCEVQIDEDHDVLAEDNEYEVEAPKNKEIGDHDPVPPEPSSGDCKKSRKRRKEKLERTSSEGTDVTFNIVKDDKVEKDSLHADSRKKNLPPENGDQGKQIENNFNVKSELIAGASQPEKKTKKKTKKKKNQGEGDLAIAFPDSTNNQDMTFENQITDPKPMQNRTLSNGLIIEEVANGPPDGKVASQGKKESGHVFDTNVGKSVYKFRLGDKEVIDGWNLGIEGMRVGDKRRLTIPPSMGYGKHGTGENVPPNSWLVYDVELVGVCK